MTGPMTSVRLYSESLLNQSQKLSRASGSRAAPTMRFRNVSSVSNSGICASVASGRCRSVRIADFRMSSVRIPQLDS